MSARSWMPLYWADYFADTTHLSTKQHGAYLLLIGHYWMRGELPNDDTQLALITKMSLHSWLKIKPAIQTFFFDGWRHKRLDQELRHAMDVYAKRVVASEKGNMMRSIKRFRKNH